MSKINAARKRIALAGFGVVGAGVYDRLAREHQSYEIAAILCRDPARRAAAGGPASLLTNDPLRLEGCDLLIEVMGGLEDAGALILNALRSGCDVVTANKSLVSRRYEALEDAARAGGGRLLFSAAAGGGVPMLETLASLPSHDPVQSVAAVLNGTTNFVLDRISEGASRAESIREAQRAGFAEADPSADIDGIDAAEKLSLIARVAFGAAIAPDDIPRTPLSAIREADIAEARAANRPVKQIASARRGANGLVCSVTLQETAADHDLARPRREENCLVAELRSGRRVVLFGKGAGRDPTADSVISDVRALSAAAAGAKCVKSGRDVNGISTLN